MGGHVGYQPMGGGQSMGGHASSQPYQGGHDSSKPSRGGHQSQYYYHDHYFVTLFYIIFLC